MGKQPDRSDHVGEDPNRADQTKACETVRRSRRERAEPDRGRTATEEQRPPDPGPGRGDVAAVPPQSQQHVDSVVDAGSKNEGQSADVEGIPAQRGPGRREDENG